jgi:hypothetical protein
VVFYLTVRTFNRQTGILQHHTTIAESAANATGANARAAEANARAAESTAEALRRNTDLMISMERARLRVKPEPLVLQSLDGFISVKYKVFFSGMTAAYVTESQAVAFVSDSEEPATDGVTPRAGVPDVFTPNAPVIEPAVFLQPSMKLEPSTVADIAQRKSFVHFWGFIKYDDVFGEHRETYFRYLWE